MNRLFLLFNIVFAVAFFGILRDLVRTSFHSVYDSYILFIPFISAYLIYEKRQTIFSQRFSFPAAGLIALSIGTAFFLVGRNQTILLDHRDTLALVTFSLVTLWIGGFTLCYGVGSLREAVFPLLFLFFTVPIPGATLDGIIFFLQTWSAEVAYGFLKAAGIPVARDGFVFHLMKLDVEVAKECSGIRSSLSLIITSVLAGYLFLRKGWSRAALVMTAVPITILKNGLRVAVLSVLGAYMDRRILDGDLHRKGGILFFFLALAIVWALIVLLRRMEGRDGKDT